MRRNRDKGSANWKFCRRPSARHTVELGIYVSVVNSDRIQVSQSSISLEVQSVKRVRDRRCDSGTR